MKENFTQSRQRLRGKLRGQIMRRIRRALCLVAAFALLGAAAAPAVHASAPAPPSTVSQTWAVLDAVTGQLVAGKDADARKFPASITKIFTVALALEQCKLDEKITMTDSMVFSIPRDATHIALTPGEEVTVEQMAYAAMVRSANDAANALAEHAGGTIENFVDMMNEKAAQLGATDTHFVNPSGLHGAEHYTTARDMGRITAWALTVPDFRTFFGATEYRMGATNKQPEQRNLGTDHCLLVTSAYTYEGATGGKLGWTPESHHTIVTVANRGGMELICVGLDSTGTYSKFKDSVALFDYSYENFERVTFSPEEDDLPQEIPLYEGESRQGAVRVTGPDRIALILPKGTQKSAVKIQSALPQRYMADQPIEPHLTFSLEGAELLSIPLAYSREGMGGTQTAPAEAKSDAKISFSLWTVLKWIGILIAAVFLLLVGLRVYFKTRRRLRRRAQRMKRPARE